NGIQGNWTNTIFQMVYVNGSLDDFAGNTNDYYGTIIFPVNFSLVQEFWWMQDETDLQSKQNITQQCGTDAFTATTTTPCWNYTSGGRTLIRVPHFSIVVAVNDSGAPTITVNVPSPNQTVSSFVSSITVTSDAVSCVYSINGTATNNTMTLTGTTCLSDQTESFKNAATAPSAYNITYTVNDSSGNAVQGVLSFNISDTTAPNNGTSITSSGTTTGATITVNSVNESITNITLVYGTSATALSLRKSEVITATKSPSIGSLGISTVTTAVLYFYNVTICDFNDNCNTTSNLTFTQSATAAGTTTTTTTTTGGGSGVAIVSNIADSKAQLWSTIPTGSSVSLNIDKTTIAVTSVEVNNVKSDLRNVDLEVASLKDNPVSADAAAKVYQYFRINKKNIVDSDAESLKISFRVTNSWLTDNGLTSGDISLYRYKSGWNELTTTVLGTDSTYVNYEADTPGFSSFAIGVKSSVEVPEEAPEGEAPEEVPEGEVAPPEPVEAPTPVVAPGKAPVAWIIAAIVIILGIVLIVLYQKKKQQQI
ncbi:MAG: PGF-pre-PGF domain-containing protein, partial [Nanoarchaeota archaeon]|nr:PGF-pre-PGF domain-containing protein [Nanoarchaeota archaeon]